MKDLYIKLLEEEMSRLEDQGIPSDKAYELAGERAYDQLGDLLRDKADQLRLRAKEGR